MKFWSLPPLLLILLLLGPAVASAELKLSATYGIGTQRVPNSSGSSSLSRRVQGAAAALSFPVSKNLAFEIYASAENNAIDPPASGTLNPSSATQMGYGVGFHFYPDAPMTWILEGGIQESLLPDAYLSVQSLTMAKASVIQARTGPRFLLANHKSGRASLLLYAKGTYATTVGTNDYDHGYAGGMELWVHPGKAKPGSSGLGVKYEYLKVENEMGSLNDSALFVLLRIGI